MKPMTIAEKILSRKAGRPVYAGEFIIVGADALMIHDSNASTTIDAFNAYGKNSIQPRPDIVMVMDHFAPCPSEAAANMHIQMRDFIGQYGLQHYQEGDGVGHQLMCERGHVFPGEIAVGTDSHSCTYGALNALGTGIGSTEAAGIMAYDKMWFRVPESVRVVWNGALSSGVAAKDVILKTVERIGLRRAIYRVLEFQGELIEQLSVASRMTMCNMGVEVGAKAAVMPADHVLETWLAQRPRKRPYQPTNPDTGAAYSESVEMNASELVPLIACPPMVNNVRPVAELAGKPVNQVIIGSCTNGRVEDFKAAAEILAGRRVADGVRLVIVPASRSVQSEILSQGILAQLLDAGGMLFTPGCGPCAGYHGGLVGRGEVVVSTTSRNFTGRMGSTTSEIYLASPLTAAATALTGCITDPREVMNS